jgi:competence protein ComEC
VQTSSLLADTAAGFTAYRRTPDYTLAVWQGRSILLINRLGGYPHWQLPAVVDYVILRRNALRNWQQLSRRVVARHLIFDDSNQPARADSLLNTKPRGLPSAVYSVRQSGAFAAEW